jgi:Cu+-exporting ATPase
MVSAFILMENSVTTIEINSEEVGRASASRPAENRCFHCGLPLPRAAFSSRDGDKAFCCQGCLAVFELLAENGLMDFYRFGETAGVRVKTVSGGDGFKYLDEPSVRERLVDFADQSITRVTFRIPAIHCIACVWLLENLFRLMPGVGHSEVNFLRKEVCITFENTKAALSEVAGLLASLGYEPELKLSDLEQKRGTSPTRRLWMQLGFAGFAFGNIMLFSISSYLGMDSFNGPRFSRLFGFISLALALPVVFYSAGDYWRAAWISLRQKMLTMDVPIAAGMVALFVQSTYEVLAGRGAGYFDSLTGLLFFLLCGKLFQQKTYNRLAFDRDYKSFFPLSVTRKQDRGEESVSLSQLQVGDRLLIRNGELIPADARLVEGPAVIDYSFVTGESEPVEKRPRDYLYAGGRQLGGVIEVEMVKAVSQSYLTSLWNQDAFCKEKGPTLDTLTNRYSRRFTKIVIGVALGSAAFWWFANPSLALKSFASVLIVACPCALALAAPFALGSAQRVLARRQVFLKNPSVIETLAGVDAVVFDKTGTLTAAGAGSIVFQGSPLSPEEERWLCSLTHHSTHPYSARISEAIARDYFPEPVRSFVETAGCGIEGGVGGKEIWMGSAAWLGPRKVVIPQADAKDGSLVHVAINGQYRGCFVLGGALRPDTRQLLTNLSAGYELALLSGDNEKECERFTGLFGRSAQLHFHQSPLNKLGFIQKLQDAGKTVMMVGDGLNDAGALKQSDVGVAVVENINAFSPASDVILAAGMVPRLHDILRFAKTSVRIVRLSFMISSLYNVAGLTIAARGLLSPVFCAILMPLSSITVVVFACGLTNWLGRAILGEPAQVFQRAGTPLSQSAEADREHPAFNVPALNESCSL